ncbi:MAG: transporter substrate-binding domain-containing protein [Clostridia bacterium]|nr:transporter substrate-binding domain-containing protein [Clostridia bacterium]
MNHKTTLKTVAAVFLLAALIVSSFAGCAEKKGDAITSLDQLRKPGRKIGVMFDLIEFDTLKKDYPNAKIIAYNDNPLGYKDVANGRIDAYVYARREMELAMENGTAGVRLLDENYSTNPVAVGISPKTPIPELQKKLNSFIAEAKADGTLDDMFRRWVDKVDETMPDIPAAENPQYHLRVGTTGTVMPYSYYVGTRLTGYDVELAYRFASWLGADVEFKIYDFSGIVSAAASGDIDCIMSNLYKTAENEKKISFSDDLFNVEITAMVRDTGKQVPSEVSVSDYNGKKIGVLVGPLMEDAAAKYFPDSEYVSVNSYPDCVSALLAGKIDGFLGDEPGMISLQAETPEVDYIHEVLTENNYAFAFRKDDRKSAALCGELNDFLEQSRADGTMEELAKIWLGKDEAKKVVDMSDLTGENGTVRVATTSTDMPWSYIKDGKNVGYDVDLTVRFCRAKGYALELGDMDFDGRIPAVQSGKYDFSTDMNVTPERKEQVLFSNPTAQGGIVLAVKASDLKQPEAHSPEYRSFADLKGKTVSMLTGAPFEELVKSKEPDVGTFTSFTSTPDMLLALKSGKTDAMLTNNAIGELAVNRDSEIALFPQSLQDGVFGFAFAKGSPERDAWQTALDAIPKETKQAVWEKWTGSDESAKVVPKQDWPGKNGTVRAAVCDTLEPMSYSGEGGELMGFDIEMILLIARELDVHVEFEGMDFSAILAAVQSGKALVGAGSIIVTPERRQAVDFAEYWPASFVLVVRAWANAGEAAKKDGGFLRAAADSFEKTFLRENRWKMFLSGIGTTLLITVLSVLFGTALGFAVFMLCRNGNPVANTVTRLCVWLIQGMPVVVLLMILFYVIFGQVAISGTIVSVIGFTLIFGAAVYSMIKAGVGAVDGGQTEAAYALGYTDRKAFFRIVLPQALPHFLPAFKGEITALIKATAVVGYVTVQDLTKIGDIVRSRTYEAFFPLIAVAVIYFILAAILTFAVNKTVMRIDPRRRPKSVILKGVKGK